jgi:regulator of cell morphogenesis and NO signaling
MELPAMTTDALEIDCEWTVGRILERYPSTAPVFNRHGIDLCCGSAVSVREAAHRDGIDTNTLCSELHEAASAPGEA